MGVWGREWNMECKKKKIKLKKKKRTYLQEMAQQLGVLAVKARGPEFKSPMP